MPVGLSNPAWDYVSTIYFNVTTRSSLTALGGGGQSAPLLQPFARPLQVLAKDDAGNPLPNTTVTFTQQYAPPYYAMANLSSMTATTNAQGIASVTATANGYGGSYSIMADAAGSSGPVTFALSNGGSSYHMQIVGGSPQSVPLLAAFPRALQVRVTDDTGYAVSGVAVTFTPHSGPPTFSSVAILSSQTVNTDANGIASVSASANGYSGFHTVTASAPGVIESPVFSLSNHGAGSQIYVNGGNNQSVQLLGNFPAPFEVLVTDDIGTPASGVLVDFTTQYVPPNYAANTVLFNTAAITDNSGVARVYGAANGYSGEHGVSATIRGTSASTTFLLRNHGSANKFGPATGTPQSAKALSDFGIPLQVQIWDDVGNPASDTVVTFAAPSSGPSASLSQQTVTTGFDGMATVRATANGEPGSFEVTASIPGAPSPFRFALTNLPLAPVINGISPNTGLPSGGTTVTLTGTGFGGATAVTVGGADVTNLDVISDTSITFSTPAGHVGQAPVVVTTPLGTNPDNSLYTYALGQQVVSFISAVPASPVVAGTYTPSATGGAGTAPVVFSVSGTCSLASGVVTFTTAGTCTVNADQAADENYEAAPQAQQSITVGKAAQTVEFTSVPPKWPAIGNSYTPMAKGGASTSPVVFSASGSCSFSNGTVTFAAAGPCTIRADQAGDDNYEVAPHVEQIIAINTVPTADAGDAQTVDAGDPVSLDGSKSSDLDNDELTYSWTQTSGTQVALSDAHAVHPSFTAPALPVGYVTEVLFFELAVSDGKDTNAVATVRITVNGALSASLTISNDSPLIGQTEELLFELQGEKPGTKSIQPFSAAAPSALAAVFTDNGNVIDGCDGVPMTGNAATCRWTASEGEHVFVANIVNNRPNAVTVASNQLVVNAVNQAVTQSEAIGGFLSDRANQIVSNLFDMNRQIGRLNQARDAGKGQGAGEEQQSAFGNRNGAALPATMSRLGTGPTSASITAAGWPEGTDVGQQDMLGLQSFLYNYLKTAGESDNYGRFNVSGPFDLNANINGGDRQASFKASLGQLMNWEASREQQEKVGLGVSQNGNATSFLPLDIWAEGTYSGFDGERSGHFGMVTVGADYVFTPEFLLGFYGQFDSMEQTSGSDITGKGWMAGPYGTLRLGENVFWQLRGGWGQSRNTITPTAAGPDSFNSTRWLISSSLSGQWSAGDFSFSPTASFSYFEDNTESYADHLGVTIPGVSTTLGQLKLSPEMSYGFEAGNGLWIEPSFAPELLWNFAQTAADGLGALHGDAVGPEGLRGRVKAGIAFRTPSGWSLNLGGSYDGIGAADYSSFNGQASVNIPLN